MCRCCAACSSSASQHFFSNRNDACIAKVRAQLGKGVQFLKCNGFRSESFFPFCCACIPPATEPVADARSALDISVAQAEANVCQAAAELRLYLSKLQKGELCNVLNAVDPNFWRQRCLFTKMELVEKVFEIPYTQWSEIFSAKPRVTSVAGPGLAHFSYAGQFSRRDDDDFWFFEPPKTVTNAKKRAQKVNRCASSFQDSR